MPAQNADSGYTILVIIALIAVIVFVLMLIAAFVIVRSERKTKTGVPPKDEQESGSPVESTVLLPVDGTTFEVWSAGESKARPFAAFFSGARRKNAVASGESARVDESPKRIQTLNLATCFILATVFAWLNFSNVQHIVNATSLSPYFILLAVVSPICIAVAWLRLTGITWRQSLMFFIWVPVAFGAIWLLSWPLGFLIKYLSGQCC